MMTDNEIRYVKQCIQTDMHKFYVWGKWKKIRREILEADKYECQDCKKKKRIVRATTVHHICHVKKYPHLALEPYYKLDGEQRRNLISLCHDCHEARHGHRQKNKDYLTTEKW